jgi:hypothetical protein
MGRAHPCPIRNAVKLIAAVVAGGAALAVLASVHVVGAKAGAAIVLVVALVAFAQAAFDLVDSGDEVSADDRDDTGGATANRRSERRRAGR